MGAQELGCSAEPFPMETCTLHGRVPAWRLRERACLRGGGSPASGLGAWVVPHDGLPVASTARRRVLSVPQDGSVGCPGHLCLNPAALQGRPLHARHRLSGAQASERVAGRVGVLNVAP